jgi:hypothetical protein
LGTSGSSHLRAPRGGSFQYEPLVRWHYVSRRAGRRSGYARRDGTAGGAGVAVCVPIGETGRADVGLAEPVACGSCGAGFAVGIAVGGTGRADVRFAEPIACSGRSAGFAVGFAVGGAGRADVGFAESIACSSHSAGLAVGIAVSGTGRPDVGFTEPVACGGRSASVSNPDADVDDASLTHPKKESHNRTARGAVRFDSLGLRRIVSITCG